MLSIIVVNMYRPDLLQQLLTSMEQHLEGFAYELIVVSNGSEERDKEEILSRYQYIKWIDMGYNSGFARANNAGLKIAAGDTFLLLNPDTIAIDHSIQVCYERFGKTDYAAVGIQLLNPDHTPQISASYFVKGGLNHVLPIPYWGALVRWLGYKANTRVPSVEAAAAEQEVDWISGAFLMVKRAAVDKVGMLDKDFFLYAEEVEWCSRLRKMGKLCVYGDLHIIHLEGAIINQATQTNDKGYYNLYDRKGLQLMVSNHLRVRKQYGVFWFLVLLLNYTWGVAFFFVCSTLHRLFTGRNPAGDWPRVGRFARNVARLWALTPRILSGKPYFYKMF